MMTPVRKQRTINPFFLDFSESQTSPAYATCLANLMRAHQETPHITVGLRLPKRKRTRSKNAGKDINAFSCQASIAAGEHSPRGFRLSAWTLHSLPSPGAGNTFAEKSLRKNVAGVLQRRPFPPKERMFFPNIISEDKEKQAWLEKRRNRQTAIAVMGIQRDEHLHKAKIKKRDERVRRSEERFNRVLKRTKRRNEVLQMVEDVKRVAEQAVIQHEIDAAVDQFHVFVFEVS